MPIKLIRHAISYYNQFGIGEHDPAITNEGLKQSEKIEGYYHLVICSPLRRCRETLNYSKIKYGELQIDPLVRERKDSPCDFYMKRHINRSRWMSLKRESYSFMTNLKS